MNKKLMAVAVAAALAAPGVALAQASSVTISGYFKVGLDNLNFSDASSGRLNTSQMRISDGSSQLVFTVIEDLGNGLSAIGRLDNRFNPDTGAIAANGNTYVGLRSNTWGTLTTGRWDLHYGKIGHGEIIGKAVALQASAVSLFDFIGQVPIANGTRTPSVIKYDSPNWNGFAATLAWSANPLANTFVLAQPPSYNTAPASEADMTFPAAANGSSRKGDGWNFNPSYNNGPFSIGYSYWRAKPDAPLVPATSSTGVVTAGSTDQRGDTVYGSYQFGGFTVGLGWNRSKLENSVGLGGVSSGTKAAQRTAWTLPVTYTFGPHTIVGHYTRAGNVSSDLPSGSVPTNDTGARMWALGYNYDLSKRTSLGVVYAKINNDDNANYNFFTSTALGSGDAFTNAGESPRLINVSIKHAF